MSITLAQLGWIHEMGNSHIPPRPFLIPALQEGRAELESEIRTALTRVLRGQESKRSALGKLGGVGERMVKEKIRSIWVPSLAESTRRRRRVSGRRHYGLGGGREGPVNPFKPLIDTGQMLNNVQWEFDE